MRKEFEERQNGLFVQQCGAVQCYDTSAARSAPAQAQYIFSPQRKAAYRFPLLDCCRFARSWIIGNAVSSTLCFQLLHPFLMLCCCPKKPARRNQNGQDPTLLCGSTSPFSLCLYLLNRDRRVRSYAVVAWLLRTEMTGIFSLFRFWIIGRLRSTRHDVLGQSWAEGWLLS